jgi:hypothetical protein
LETRVKITTYNQHRSAPCAPAKPARCSEWKNHTMEGIANHIDPESCGAARKGGVEALTGERMGQVFSRVRTHSGTLTP